MINKEDLYEDIRSELFPGKNPQAIVLADSRASDLLLTQTLDHHLPSNTTVFLDHSSSLGRSIVDHRLANDQPTGLIEISPNSLQDAPDTLPVITLETIDENVIASLKARIIIVPAMAGSGEVFIDTQQPGTLLDFGPTTLSGLIADAARGAEVAIAMIDAPERGLVRYPDNEGEHDYSRRLFVIGLEEDSTLKTSTITETIEN